MADAHVRELLLAAERKARDRYADGDHEAHGAMMAAHAARMEVVAEQAKYESRQSKDALQTIRLIVNAGDQNEEAGLVTDWERVAHDCAALARRILAGFES